MSFKTPKQLKSEDFQIATPNIEEIIEKAKAEFQHSLDFLAKIHGTNTDLRTGEAIEADDLVALQLESDFPYFNGQNIPLKVGANLYCKDLEEQLIGKKVGEEFSIDVDYEGKHTVKGSITNARRSTPAEINDELIQNYAAAEGADPKYCSDLTTFEDSQISMSVLAQLQDFFQNNLFGNLVKKLAEESDLVLSNEERQASYNECMQGIAAITEAQKISELEAFQQMMGPEITDLDTAREKLRETSDFMALLNRYAAELLSQSGEEPTEAEYEEMLKDFVASENVPEELLRQQLSYEQYLEACRQEYLNQALFREYIEYLDEKYLKYL